MKKHFNRLSFIFALLLSILVVSTFAISASAAEYTNPTLCLTEYNTMPGQEFSTTLYIAENAEIGTFQVSLKYNTDLVTLVSAEED